MIFICDVDLFKTLRHWGALGTKTQDAIIISSMLLKVHAPSSIAMTQNEMVDVSFIYLILE